MTLERDDKLDLFVDIKRGTEKHGLKCTQVQRSTAQKRFVFDDKLLFSFLETKPDEFTRKHLCINPAQLARGSKIKA